jgi:hypothetical protein
LFRVRQKRDRTTTTYRQFHYNRGMNGLRKKNKRTSLLVLTFIG